MNHTEIVKEVANRSNESVATCELIIKGYEEYCEHNITRTSSKHIDAITEFVSRETGIDNTITRNVVGNLLDVIQAQLKNKIPFMSK